jgi:hypothetical protein
MPTKLFPIAISPLWRGLLLPLGVTPKRSFVEVADGDVHIRFGWFDYHFPLEAVERATLARWPIWAGVGVRTNFRGTVGLIGTYVNVVEVTFAEPQQMRLLVRTGCRRLFLSLQDPHSFITALTRHRATEAKAA